MSGVVRRAKGALLLLDFVCFFLNYGIIYTEIKRRKRRRMVVTKHEKSLRQKRVDSALGIAMVEGRRPSQMARDITKQYVNGEISAEQMKQTYLKKSGLAL